MNLQDFIKIEKIGNVVALVKQALFFYDDTIRKETAVSTCLVTRYDGNIVSFYYNKFPEVVDLIQSAARKFFAREQLGKLFDSARYAADINYQFLDELQTFTLTKISDDKIRIQNAAPRETYLRGRSILNTDYKRFDNELMETFIQSLPGPDLPGY